MRIPPVAHLTLSGRHMLLLLCCPWAFSPHLLPATFRNGTSRRYFGDPPLFLLRRWWLLFTCCSPFSRPAVLTHDPFTFTSRPPCVSPPPPSLPFLTRLRFCAPLPTSWGSCLPLPLVRLALLPPYACAFFCFSPLPLCLPFLAPFFFRLWLPVLLNLFSHGLPPLGLFSFRPSLFSRFFSSVPRLVLLLRFFTSPLYVLLSCRFLLPDLFRLRFLSRCMCCPFSTRSFSLASTLRVASTVVIVALFPHLVSLCGNRRLVCYFAAFSLSALRVLLPPVASRLRPSALLLAGFSVHPFALLAHATSGLVAPLVSAITFFAPPLAYILALPSSSHLPASCCTRRAFVGFILFLSRTARFSFHVSALLQLPSALFCLPPGAPFFLPSDFPTSCVFPSHSPVFSCFLPLGSLTRVPLLFRCSLSSFAVLASRWTFLPSLSPSAPVSA